MVLAIINAMFGPVFKAGSLMLMLCRILKQDGLTLCTLAGCQSHCRYLVWH